jgi:hypothetical protein
MGYLLAEEIGDDSQDEGLEDKDAAEYDPHRHLDGRPHKGKTDVVRIVWWRPVAGYDGSGLADHELFFECNLGIGYSNHVDDGDATSQGKGGHENDLLPTFYSE